MDSANVDEQSHTKYGPWDCPLNLRNNYYWLPVITGVGNPE